MKAKMMTIKMLTAAIAVVGLSSGVMADSAGHNLDATASKEASKPTPVLEQIFIYQVEHAKAEDIKTCIDTLVIESRKEVLAGCATNATEANSVLFRGKVVVIADKYSNKLIIVTEKANYDCFEKIIKQLDVDRSPPAISVRVFGLQNADAEYVASVINDFGGSPNTLVNGNVKVRVDKRINGVVVMANSDEMPTIASIITKLDIKSNCESAIVDAEIKALSGEMKSSYDAIMSHCDRIDEISEDAEVVRRKLAELEKVRVEKGLKSWAQIDPKIRDEIDKKYPCGFMLDKTRQ